MKLQPIIFLVFFGGLLMSCSNSGNKNEEDLSSVDTVIAPESFGVAKESMEELIENVSSPIEIASLLLEEKVPFNKEYIVSTKHVDDLVSDFDCAINLGLLGTDLGYLNLYEKTGSVMSTVSAINDLSDKLKVGQFFDFELLKRLANNSNNLDSLIFTSVSSFNDMDEYLRANSRTNVSALIVSGVWLESTYLATQVYKSKSNKKIAERIGEQKIILNNLVIIIENYSSDPRFAELLVDLKKLQTLYQEVSIVNVDAQPESKVVNGMLVITQTSTSTVNITDELISKIGLEVTALRNKMINVKA
jgi:hypothetical protein